MSLLPANATARRREEEIRVRERLALMERKLDEVILKGFSGTEAAKAPPPSPAVQDLALAIGQDRILLPLAVIVSRTLNDEGDEVATAISVDHLSFTIEEAVRLGVLALDGRLNRSRLTTLLNATRPGWRPLYAASGPTQPVSQPERNP
jgi:hypothetical protein